MKLLEQELWLGANFKREGTQFLVWAPKCRSVDLVLKDPPSSIVPLSPSSDGYFQTVVTNLRAGTRYRYRLNGDGETPDPCSRFQPEGPHGDSVVIDPAFYQWRDNQWSGVSMHGQIIYELHIGTFTQEGTFAAAQRELKELKTLGITTIEIMPLHENAGRWNWGYDNVGMFAPYHVYGDPNAVKQFVDAAHGLGMGVILDVVYNHLGPDGNYLGSFSDDYMVKHKATDWGDSINFDGPNSEHVRNFFIQNACYWIREFHFDGLRLDATQNIYDKSPVHILADISKAVRSVAPEKSLILIAENDTQDVRLITSIKEGGYGLDGVWNDDFHHAARVALTGNRKNYFSDFAGPPQEFASLTKDMFLYQGQHSVFLNGPRGKPVTFQPAEAFVTYLQNHDQISIDVGGHRIHALTSSATYRAMAAVLFLGPTTPLIFMGQEFGATSPFPFFCDHQGDLANSVNEGRRKFVTQFIDDAAPERLRAFPKPTDERTFRSAKLNLNERNDHKDIYLLHKDLIALRKADPAIERQDRFQLDTAVLGSHAFLIRFFDSEHGDRLLVTNLGPDFIFDPCSEPLIAAPENQSWHLTWSSEDRRYGGTDKKPQFKTQWHLPSTSSFLFTAMNFPTH